ncbi:MAG: co-chaperone GroES [Gemmatimonadetes bacterium]|nr:co-chaperone GroES [Gemmatimonadota bacterium]MBE85308.1 co-chaperone GroES [Gemmatimonadota bacterium]HCK11669.1 co-chaperone GroES [Candidatus Latescibacterota bacterium]
MKIHPLGDRILIKRLEEEEQVSGGIIIPDTAKEKPQEAEVVAVGPGRRGDDGDLIAMDVQPGQKILVGKYAGNEIEVDGEEYVILSEDDVLGILE